jgi:hypothetical protein
MTDETQPATTMLTVEEVALMLADWEIETTTGSIFEWIHRMRTAGQHVGRDVPAAHDGWEPASEDDQAFADELDRFVDLTLADRTKGAVLAIRDATDDAEGVQLTLVLHPRANPDGDAMPFSHTVALRAVDLLMTDLGAPRT